MAPRSQKKQSDSQRPAKRNLFKPFQNTKPYFGFNSLEEGNYEIVTFRFVRNKFYDPKADNPLKRNLVAELKDQILFLPAVIARNFLDDDVLLDEINNDGVKRFLRFGGKKDG